MQPHPKHSQSPDTDLRKAKPVNFKIHEKFSSDVCLAVEATARAGQVILDGFERTIRIDQKADMSLVTECDHAAEKVILDVLLKQTDHAVLSEEVGELPGKSGLKWVIDPIDGTTNFSRKLPVFAVSIALMSDTETLLGLIHLPLTNEFYYAETGKGAHCNESPIQVSKTVDPSRSLVMIENGRGEIFYRSMVKLIERLIGKFDVRWTGSTAVELVQLACGQADAFISCGDKIWDYAAGLLIVEEAGGIVTDWNGEKRDGSHSYVLASNEELHAQLLSSIQGLQAG